MNNRKAVFFNKEKLYIFSYQNCSSDREKLLKFEAGGREFAKILRSLEQFIQTVKGQKKRIWLKIKIPSEIKVPY